MIKSKSLKLDNIGCGVRAVLQAFVLNKMQLHRREMRPLINRLVEDVQRDQFHESLVMLGLEDYEQQPQSADEASASVAGSVRKSQAATSFTGEPVITKYARVSFLFQPWVFFVYPMVKRIRICIVQSGS